MKKTKKISHLQSYMLGFVFSVVLTIIPYYLVVEQKLSGDGLLFTVMGYAILQLIVQLVFFLHLGEEKGPRWNLMSIVFLISVMLFIGLGTIWIMKNLHHYMNHAPSPQSVEGKLIESQNIYYSPDEDHHDH